MLFIFWIVVNRNKVIEWKITPSEGINFSSCVHMCVCLEARDNSSEYRSNLFMSESIYVHINHKTKYEIIFYFVVKYLNEMFSVHVHINSGNTHDNTRVIHQNVCTFT